MIAGLHDADGLIEAHSRSLDAIGEDSSREPYDLRIIAEGLSCCQQPVGIRHKIIIKKNDHVNSSRQCCEGSISLCC
jgi:hypothetical protein